MMDQAHEARNYKDLVRAYAAGAKSDFVFFWGHTPKREGVVGKECLSQWYAAPFTVDRIVYPTAEHYMMAEKALLFGDRDAYKKILGTPDPGNVQAIGRSVRGFDAERWQQHAFEVVVRGNFEKFSQNEEPGRFLLGTGDRVLVEASPSDRIWGIGLPENATGIDQPARWRGQNLLGFALMEARVLVRRQVEESIVD